jgi:DUF971 family protein
LLPPPPIPPRYGEGMTERSGPEPETAPSELRCAADGSRLVAVWPDGGQTSVSAMVLRRACRCAECTARRARGEPAAGTAEVAITNIAAIGGYAVNIVFSDGHRRGIFPWAFLRTLAEPAAGN